MGASLLLTTIVHCYVGCNVGSSDRQALHVLECDTETGAAKLVQSVTGVQDTTYFQFSRDGRFLYSFLGEKKGGKSVGTIVRFAMDGWRLGTMERLAELPCEAPCHLMLTPDERRVAFASYGSGTVGTVGVDGTDLKTFVLPDDAMGPNRRRQKKAHAHQAYCLPDGELGVADLGCDRIWFFDPVTMRRETSLEIKTDAGDGPRHMLLSKDGKFLFVVNELSSTIISYAVPVGQIQRSNNPTIKQFSRIGKWSMLPPDADPANPSSWASAIKLTADGKILMASNRGHESIAFYAVNADGTLTLKNIAKLTGSFPRDFELMPGEKFMVVGHEKSDSIQVYRFDRVACTLTPVGAPISAWHPLCFVFGR